MASQAVTGDYDPMADVLYLSVGEPTRRALSEEDEMGLIWRRSPEGECLGVTIPDFKFCWSGRHMELAQILAAHLPFAEGSARSQIREYA